MIQPRVAAAVVVSTGGLLLVRRRVPAAGLVWQLPAGKIELGESAARAAVRETREETGLRVAPVVLIGERTHPATGRRVAYVACEVVGGMAWAASPREVSEIDWVGHGDLPRYVPGGFYRPVQDYLDEALER